MRYATMMAAALMLAACTQQATRWVHPSKAIEAQQQDWNECRFEAVRVSSGIVMANAFTQGFERAQAENRMMEACMVARGYRLEATRVVTVTANEPAGAPK